MDAHLYRLVNEFQTDTGWLHGTAQLYAKTGGPLLLALLLLAGVVVARSTRNLERVAAAGWAGLSTVVAVGLNQPLIKAVGRTRPFLALPHVHVLGTPSTDPSFPSDHGTLAGAALAGLFLVDKRLGAAATVVGLLLGVGRVYVGAHYPGDVLAGLAFGALVAVGGWYLLRRPLVWLVERLAATRLRPLLTS